MKKFTFFLFLTTLSLLINAQPFLSGYSKAIKGDNFEYHSPQPDAGFSMLIRAENSSDFIEWETEPIPANYQDKKLHFLLLAGIDVNPGDPHQWDIFINNQKYFTISSPLDTVTKEIVWKGSNNSGLKLFKTKTDRHGDFMGYLDLTLDASDFEKGKTLLIRVSGQNANSRTWFMVFKYQTQNTVKLLAENAVRYGVEGETQIIKTEVAYYGEPVMADFKVGDFQFQKELKFGYNVHYLEIPRIDKPKIFRVNVKIGNNVLANENVELKPVKNLTIYLLHHSHVDIGYTHVQEEVEKIQWNHLEKSIQFAENSKNNLPGDRFKWNTEVMWAVDSYLRNATEEKKQKLLLAIKIGDIELDGFFANELTGLCTPEELFELLAAGRKISHQAGVKLQSAMITDIPGWTWAIVPALAQSGIKYLSLGTNRGHRIGDIIEKLGDKPFYWISPSGNEKVLTWVHHEGYSLFHTGLGATNPQNLLGEEKILPYVNWLANSDYPYELAILRYNIGSDNGPPDESLAHLVKKWNEIYLTPKLVISTVSESFGIFEEKYGKSLPEKSGDISGYWEDGAASSAKETVINRENAIKLSQAETLFSMTGNTSFREKDFEEAWRNVLLYDEHTWGSWNSISEPEAPFTLQQWETKRNFSLKAEVQSKNLVALALKNRVSDNQNPEAIEVLNTCSWPRTDWVALKVSQDFAVEKLVDENGNSVLIKKPFSVEFWFLASDVPAFGSKIYTIESEKMKGLTEKVGATEVMENQIESKDFLVNVNKENGSIEKLIWKKNGQNLVDTTKRAGINQYFYVNGRNPESPKTAKVKKIYQNNNRVLIVDLEAPGCKNLRTEIRLNDEKSQIEIVNILDKEKIYTPEGVHFAFPFEIKNGIMRYDLAFGHCQPEKDQIPGSNRNFITIENWVDISNDNFGVTVASPDAPLIEVGEITCDPTVFGYIRHLEQSQTFFSYPMNNYWETNYLAAQEGEVEFRYSLKFHEVFDAAEAEKTGIESRVPMIVIPVNKEQKPLVSPFIINNSNIIVFGMKPALEGTLVSLYNCSEQPQIFETKDWKQQVFISDIDGKIFGKPIKSVELSGFGIEFLIIK